MLPKFPCVSLTPHARLAVLAGLPVFILRTGQAPDTPPRRKRDRDMWPPGFYVFCVPLAKANAKHHTTAKVERIGNPLYSFFNP